MKTKLFLFLALSLVVFNIFLPSLVFAGITGLADPTRETTGDVGCGDGGGLPNPLNVCDPRVVIGNIIKAVLGIVGSLALATFILGGFFWVTSAGNEEKIKKGKDMILWASFGLAVIFFSYALVTFVINAVAGSNGG